MKSKLKDSMVVATEKDPYTLTVFTSSSGCPSARLDREDGTFLHLHSLVDPQAEADYYATIEIWGDKLIFAGAGLGYHLGKLLRKIKIGSTVLIIEYYQELADACAQSVEGATGIRPQIISGATEDVLSIETAFSVKGGMVQIIRHPPSFRAHRSFYDPILQQLGSCRHRERTGTLLHMQGNFFVEREMVNAAAGTAVTSVPFLYRNYESVTGYESRLQQMIGRYAPDCILSINMLGVDHNGIFTDYTQRHGIPSVHWFVDDPRPMLLTRGRISTGMIACTWEKAYIPFLKEAGFGAVHYLPLATDATRRMLDFNAAPSVTAGFVGSSMNGAFLEDIAGKFVWREGYGDTALLLAKEFPEGDTGNLDERISEELGRFGDITVATMTWFRSYVLHTASMLKRKKLLAPLLPLGLELFGDAEGWRSLLGENAVVHPDLDYQSETVIRYNDTAVNVNVTSCQMVTAVNQRVFDVPAGGGFLLTDHRKDLEELFAPGEYVMYENEEDIVQKTAYYCKHPEMRKACTTAARNRILTYHTYRHRLEKIISLL